MRFITELGTDIAYLLGKTPLTGNDTNHKFNNLMSANW
jgi:hypothetical protein